MDQLIAVLVGAVGPSGALIWFLYHTTTKTIPDIVSTHRAEVASLVVQFREDLREERELRRSLLAEVLSRVPYVCPNSDLIAELKKQKQAEKA
jgi:hypothetical protein